MIREAYIIKQVFAGKSPELLQMWQEIFDKGTTKFFEYGFVTYFDEDGIRYVNSATVGDIPFSNKMLIYIYKVVKNKENVVLGSSIPGIRTLINYGFTYDPVNQLYIKGSKYNELYGG
jgi:hypothetical protein